MRPSADPRQGFSLIEAVVAIAVVAILAGMITPMALKVLNQQREARTRDSLRTAFEALFGARDRRVANLHADTGYSPGATQSNLGALTLLGSSGVTKTYGYNGYAFFWGWNGPYWQGSTDASSSPVDGWGVPMRLVYALSGGIGYWQAQSAGQDHAFGTADDLVYPPGSGGSVISYNATLIVNVNKSVASNFTGNIRLTSLNGTDSPTVSASKSISNTSGFQPFTWNVNAGGMQVDLAPTGAGTFTTVTLPMDLLPGETRTVDVTI